MYFNQDWESLHGFETEFVKVFYYDFKEGFSDKYHSYSYHKICTILDGEKNVRVGDKNFSYNKDEYILLAPHSEVDMTMPVPTKAMVLELNDSLIRSVNSKVTCENNNEIKLKNYNYLYSKMNPFLKDTMKMVNQSINMKDQDKRFLIDLAAQKLAYSLLKDESSCKFLSTQMSNNPMTKALELIRSGNGEITVSEVANKLFMSVSAFSNSFKKYYGISPNQYIRKYRMNKAMYLLKDKTVGEVAYELGYNNVSHFIEIFKNYNKLTPKQYQIQQIKNNIGM